MIGAAFGLGFILGPVIGGYLGQFGSRIPLVKHCCLYCFKKSNFESFRKKI